ncbi:type II toxin-antitoxin system RelE/ParE family toxin [Streptomyces goshikiensis]
MRDSTRLPHRFPGPTPPPPGHRRTGPSSRATAWVGSYRIAYQVLDGELVVLVVEVGDRRDVYRGIRRADTTAAPR